MSTVKNIVCYIFLFAPPSTHPHPVENNIFARYPPPPTLDVTADREKMTVEVCLPSVASLSMVMAGCSRLLSSQLSPSSLCNCRMCVMCVNLS